MRLCMLFVILLLIQNATACLPHWRHRVRALYNKIVLKNQEEIPGTNLEQEQSEYEIAQIYAGSLRKTHPEGSFFGPLATYTDEGGCYEEGGSHRYTGAVSFTETGRTCTDWTLFTVWVRMRLQMSLKSKRENMLKLSLFSKRYDSAKDDAIIAATNDTIRDMERQGLLNHNHCRDPDRTGVPWCFVDTASVILWEPCSVPKCTPCWRMRQRSRRYYHLPRLLQTTWVPSCAEDGSFSALQCWSAYCWCSDRNGMIIKGTLSKKSEGKPYCGVGFQMGVRRFTAKRTTSPKPPGSLNPKATSTKPKPKKKARPNSKERVDQTTGKRKKRKKVKSSNVKVTNNRTRRQKLSVHNEIMKEKNQQNLDLDATPHATEGSKQPKAYRRLLSKFYKTSKPYISITNGRKYVCRVRYLMTSVLYCANVKTRPSWRLRRGNGTRTARARRCYVKRNVRVESWRCQRHVTHDRWHVISYRRVNRELLGFTKDATVYRGMRFICTRTKKTDERGYRTRCKATASLLKEVYTRNRGEDRYVCLKYYRNGILRKQNCIKRSKRTEKKRKRPTES